jgi:phosphoglycolate phosphatase
MKYKLAIFDFDGTLANSFPWALSIVDGMAEKYQLKKVDIDEIETLRGLDARQLIKLYGVRWWKLPAMVKDVRGLMSTDAHKIPLFEGVGELLSEVSTLGITLALVTANSLQNVQKILGPDIFNMFTYIEDSVSIFAKTARFKKILRKSGFQPNDAICIGDEIRDIQAAKKAHISACAVDWGYTRADALRTYAPEQIFTSMAEIVQELSLA